MPTRKRSTLFHLFVLLSIVFSGLTVPFNSAAAGPAGTALQFNGSNQYVTFGNTAAVRGTLVTTPTWQTALNSILGSSSLAFNGTNQYVTFGAAPELGVQYFTIETWFYRTGLGVATSTGTGGLSNVIPLVTKGRGEADTDNRDMNYFLGLHPTTGALMADFEECAPAQAGCPAGGIAGANHPVSGVTPAANNTWNHAAATYDGTTWRLYLNGQLDAELVVMGNRLPRWDSIQHAGLATALNSTGTADGYFQGRLDEVRIWNVARTQAEIQASMNAEILTPTPGLLARWGLNDGAGTSASNLNRLGMTTFTLESWVKRAAGGVTMSTGTNGFDGNGDRPLIYPVLTRGLGEGESPANININYFLGITADGFVGADFEDTAGGVNHPAWGTTALPVGEWHHIAATYSGTCWTLYVDGSSETLNALAVACPNATPESTSFQHAGLAAGLGSTGQLAAGYFSGVIDEARLWNRALTPAEILANKYLELTNGTGLVARWGMNETSGTTINSSVGTFPGTLSPPAGPATWVPGFPIPETSPPNAPTDLTATATAAFLVDLAWSDNATNEASFEVERCTGAGCGSFGLLVTLDANSEAYADTSILPQTDYCYRVRAVNSAGPSDYSNTACVTTPAEGAAALDLAPTACVTFGDDAATDLAQFTLETWFRRDGTGTPSTTGSGGIANALPLISNGAPEADNSNVDMNYVLCIDNTTGTLCADFEEGAGGTSPGLNHPVYGVTAIATGVWYHAAVTYDGSTWRLYLNGVLENELAVGQPVRADNVSPTALATMLESDNTTNGFFDGALDEVRIWNYARTETEIRTTINSELAASQAGLVARWGLNEGAGTVVHGTAGTTVDGTIVSGTGSYTWITPGAPFNITFPTEPPAAPTDLNATTQSHSEIALSWVDNATTESSFKIERCTGAGCGDFSLRATVGANTITYNDTGLSAATTYCYRVKASNLVGDSLPSNVGCATTAAAANYALDLSNPTGTAAANLTYVKLGNPAELRLTQVTIEAWFRRDGQGVSDTTGTGGIGQAVPLVARGAAQGEDPLIDLNYLLGIDDATDTLAADFEEGSAGASPSLNHPVYGVTPLSVGVWYHAAATYDGSTWKLYLNGNLEATLTVNQPMADAANSMAAIGTSLRSNGTTAQGGFDGALDEVRIWSVARTQAEIQASMQTKFVTPQPNLVARWGLDENMGADVNDAARSAFSNGVITGANATWMSGAPVTPPGTTLTTPANGAIDVAIPANLQVAVSDPEAEPLTVTFYGRAAKPSSNPAFTVVMLPDTQYYAASYPGTFSAQTQWIVDNRTALNIPYVAQVGDCVDDASVLQQWINADAAIDLLENPITTGLPEGMPYGIAVGNHDQSPNGDPNGTSTANFNQYFGISRFAPGGIPRGYYGGPYGANNDNMVELFSAGGMDFIAIYFEYDTAPDQSVLDWADNLLRYYPLRRGIVVTHHLIGIGNPGSFSAQGQIIYNALKDNPNLFLMLGGHVPGEGRRQDTFGGTLVNTLLADFQGRTNGGNGWLRRLDFDPAAEQISVKTYSPTLAQFETDADSQFVLSYIQGDLAFQQIGMPLNVTSGSTASMDWDGLTQGEMYEWYATISDGKTTTMSPVWHFSAGTPLAANLASFEAIPQPDHVLVTWETTSEIDNLGFNLYRATTPSGPQQPLNTTLIPSQAPGSSQGFVYTWPDFAVTAGTTYYYWLEAVSATGGTVLHGPVSATYQGPTAATVSGLSAQPARQILSAALLAAALLAAVSFLILRLRRSDESRC